MFWFLAQHNAVTSQTLRSVTQRTGCVSCSGITYTSYVERVTKPYARSNHDVSADEHFACKSNNRARNRQVRTSKKKTKHDESLKKYVIVCECVCVCIKQYAHKQLLFMCQVATAPLPSTPHRARCSALLAQVADFWQFGGGNRGRPRPFYYRCFSISKHSHVETFFGFCFSKTHTVYWLIKGFFLVFLSEDTFHYIANGVERGFLLFV